MGRERGAQGRSTCKQHGPHCAGHRSAARNDRAVLEPEELHRMIAASDGADRAVLLLLYDLALRASEVPRIRAEDIDWASGEVRVRRVKNGPVVALGVAPTTLAAVRPYASTGSVFPWPTWRIKRLVRRAARAARLSLAAAGEGGKAFSHILRRSRATHLLAAGVELRQVQRRLGHRSWRTTMLYAGVSQARSREVDEIAAGMVPCMVS